MELPKLLYVDDEPINLEILKMSLRKYYAVITAESGLEGLSILEEDREINIVITDLKMPNMDGLEFITHARVKFPDLNYYILSGFQLNDDIRQAIDKKHVLKFFKKPMDVELILETLAKT